MQDEFIISKEELSKLVPEYTNPDSKVMQEIYEMCLQDKVKAHSHEEIALLLFLVIKFKWEQIFKRSANLELCLKDFKEKQDVYDLYRLFRRTKFEIGLTIIFENDPMFDSIIEDYKFCRRKTYEYSVLQNITIREMSSVYSFAYSIYDKIAYLFRDVYDIDVPEDKVDFTEKNLFSRPYKNSNQKFYEIKNPAIIPLYLESQEVRAKNKPKGIEIGTAELNEFRNFIEHKSTLLIDADKLKSKSEQLIRNIRDLIIESYLLLQGSKENMTGDLTVCAGTAFAKGLQIHNQLNKKS